MGSEQVPASTKIGRRCYATALRKASRRMSQFYDDALEPSGIKGTQRAILAEIERSGPISVRALANAMVMDAGGLAHTLKPLVRDGLISIRTGLDDRRNRLISIEAAGVAKIRQSDALFEVAQERFERAFGFAEASALRDAMRLIASPQFLDLLEDSS